MKQVFFQDNWPESWKYSYEYDRQEIYGDIIHPGYSYAYELRKNRTIALVQKYVKPGGSILDVAAAQGNFSLTLAELGYKVTWNDIRKELKDYVELKREKGIINYAPGNVFEVDFSGKFDCVLITEIIEHVAHPDDFLERIAQLLKPDGVIVMTTPNGGYFLNKLPKFSECRDPSVFESEQFGPNSDDHIFLLHEDEVSMLAEKAGLKVIETQMGTNSLSNGHLKTHFLLKILPKGLIFVIEKLTACLPRVILRKTSTNIAAVLGRSR